MLYFSSLLQTTPAYKPTADRLFAALYTAGLPYRLLEHTRDIWLRDFMPVRSAGGMWIAFRYEPSYLRGYSQLRTDYRRELAPWLPFSVRYSNINLDGGNVVFSPDRSRVILSDRVLAENPEYDQGALLEELERLLEAQVVLIPSLKSDMTGHTDGMVRFVDETTVIGNHTGYKRGLEQRIRSVLRGHGLNVVDFPYFPSHGISAEGCYLNYLETASHVFLPVYGAAEDREAVLAARQLFPKKIVPVDVREIARDGGALNCISWENDMDVLACCG
jgi:agmatine deiminase